MKEIKKEAKPLCRNCVHFSTCETQFANMWYERGPEKLNGCGLYKARMDDVQSSYVKPSSKAKPEEKKRELFEIGSTYTFHLVNGEVLSDVTVEWIQDGFIAGFQVGNANLPVCFALAYVYLFR